MDDGNDGKGGNVPVKMVLPAVLLGQVRIIFAAFGGILATLGLVTSADVEKWIPIALEIAGLLFYLIPAVWSVIMHFRYERKTQVREAVAFNAGQGNADNTIGPTPTVPVSEVPALIAKIAPQMEPIPLTPVSPDVVVPTVIKPPKDGTP